MLAAFPLTTARDKALVEALSLPGVTRHINMFLCKVEEKGAVDLSYTPVVSIATGLKL